LGAFAGAAGLGVGLLVEAVGAGPQAAIPQTIRPAVKAKNRFFMVFQSVLRLLSSP
jgi:hypothetical protein